MKPNATSPRFFEQKYRHDPDPWHFSTSEYEQCRYAAILNALQDRRYKRAFEPGCSIGVLTVQLARVCDRIEAIDTSATAVKLARRRCAAVVNVELRCGFLPSYFPSGFFDLIVFSEIGYYFDERQLGLLGSRLVGRLSTGGVFLAAHWLGFSDDHRLSGDRVHEILSAIDGLSRWRGQRYAAFQLDRWERQ